MAFVRLRGQVWYIGYTDEAGKRIQRASPARTKTEARAMAAELERRAKRVKLGLEDATPAVVTLAQVADEYLRVVTAQQRDHKITASRIRRLVVKPLGARVIATIKPVDVESLLADMARDGYSPKMRRHVRGDLSALFDFARKRMRVMTRENPVGAVPQIKLPRRTPRYLTLPQVEALLAGAGDFRLMLMVAVLTGLRKGELCGLRWTDVDLERRIVLVRRSYDHDTTKSGRERPVAIALNLLPELAAAKAAATSALVFPAPDGSMRRHFNASRMLNAALKRAGLVEGYRMTCRRKDCRHVEPNLYAAKVKMECPECRFALWPIAVPLKFTLKDLRSTFGTLGYEATGDIRFIQASLGHTDVRVTEEHYAALRSGHLVTQVDRIGIGGPARPPK